MFGSIKLQVLQAASKCQAALHASHDDEPSPEKYPVSHCVQYEAPASLVLVEVFPAGHSAQLVPALYVPLRQMSQADIPATVLALPFSHLIQSLVPVVELEYFPAGHMAQEDASAEYFPGGHETHTVDPKPAATMPALQSVHASEPLADAVNFPGGHMAQVEASEEYEPGAHMTHAVAPNPEATLPAPQSVHLSVPFVDAENFPGGHKVQELTVE